jgi:hypothetical protein
MLKTYTLGNKEIQMREINKQLSAFKDEINNIERFLGTNKLKRNSKIYIQIHGYLKKHKEEIQKIESSIKDFNQFITDSKNEIFKNFFAFLFTFPQEVEINKIEIEYLKLQDEIKKGKEFDPDKFSTFLKYNFRLKYTGKLKVRHLNFPVIEIFNKFRELENDSRVLFICYNDIIRILDDYFDVKIISYYLNLYFPAIVNRKKTNRIHSVYTESIKYSSSLVQEPLILGEICQNDRKIKINPLNHIIITLLIEKIKSYASEFDIQIFLDNYLKGNYRFFDKLFFQDFYKLIYLRKQLENKKQLGLPIKKVLLFDVFKIFYSECEFLSEQNILVRPSNKSRSLSSGFYDKYKRDVVKNIIGI